MKPLAAALRLLLFSLAVPAVLSRPSQPVPSLVAAEYRCYPSPMQAGNSHRNSVLIYRYSPADLWRDYTDALVVSALVVFIVVVAGFELLDCARGYRRRGEIQISGDENGHCCCACRQGLPRYAPRGDYLLELDKKDGCWRD